MKIVIATGGFDPLHSGHVKYLEAARRLGDLLLVGLNSDDWLARKKGRPFMPWAERAAVLRALRCVDRVVGFDDSDGSAVSLIQKTKDQYQSDIVFANGGDRTRDNIPELVFKDVEFVFGVGGEDKQNSSSSILRDWAVPSTQRAWGKYRVLAEGAGWRVKELQFDEHGRLSLQRHAHRAEHWRVVEGHLLIERDGVSQTVGPLEEVTIPAGVWHRATAVRGPATVIELWTGSRLSEDDIERSA